MLAASKLTRSCTLLSTVVLNSRDRQGNFKRLKKRARITSRVITITQKTSHARIGTALAISKMFLNV